GLTSGLTGGQGSLLTPAAYANNIRALTGRLSYPIGRGRRAFAEFQNAQYAGAQLAARKHSIGAGVEFSLNRIMGFTVGLALHDYRDAQHHENDYHARLLNANLAARF